MRITVLGATGFIGSHITESLLDLGIECLAIRRGDSLPLDMDLDCVIDCVGLTADFRKRSLETVTAHVCRLVEIFQRAHFSSFLYLSSTRVYAGATTGNEDSQLRVQPTAQNEFYNLSKLMGESLCLAHPNSKVRVVRLSNVYGVEASTQNFLASILSNMLQNRHVNLETSLLSAKDYVSIKNVIKVLPQIATQGIRRLYNVASGRNTSNEDLLKRLSEITRSTYNVVLNAPTITYPLINISRVKQEFHFEPSMVLDDLPWLVESYKEKFQQGYYANRN